MIRSLGSSVVRFALVVLVAVTAHMATATPIALDTPAGLSPGDTFRFMFVTGSTTTASSPNIDFYNTFVQNAAGGATYNGVVVNWKAIGSTDSVDARDNVGGFGSSVPVYLPTGVKVANNLSTGVGGLWSGSLLAAPNQYLNGAAGSGFTLVFTGSQDNGLKGNDPLGRGNSIAGAMEAADSVWINWDFDNSANHLYGLSGELTAPGGVPEIDPAGMASVLSLVVGALAMAERRLRRGHRAADRAAG